jgi:hypothetical protein
MHRIYSLTSNISDAILTASLANSDAVSYQGQILKQTVQKATSKIVGSMFDSQSTVEYISGNSTADSNSDTSFSFDASSSASNSTNGTNVYRVNKAIFTDNPLRYDSSFPY